MKKREHYTAQEKEKLLTETGWMTNVDATAIANILDCYSMRRLQQISSAIRIMSKGK